MQTFFQFYGTFIYLIIRLISKSKICLPVVFDFRLSEVSLMNDSLVTSKAHEILQITGHISKKKLKFKNLFYGFLDTI